MKQLTSYRNSILVCLVLAAGALAVPATASCTPGEKQAINSAIDVAGYACVIANADLVPAPGNTLEAAIAAACGMVTTLEPDIKQIVDDFKMKRASYAKQQMSAARCDAGAK